MSLATRARKDQMPPISFNAESTASERKCNFSESSLLKKTAVLRSEVNSVGNCAAASGL